MKNRGFTLIELLGIIVLLVIMSAFAFPALNKLLKDAPGMEQETFEKLVKNAGEVYMGSHYDEFNFNENEKVSIPIQFLIEEGYLRDTVVNPKTNKAIKEEDGYIEAMKNSDNTLSYLYTVYTINAPVLPENMIAVYYDETCNNSTGCWRKADRTNSHQQTLWYDYINRRWANAVTVRASADQNVLNSKSRQEYLDADPGTIIADDDILTFFVWIPRYEYNLDSLTNYAGGNQSNPGAIAINFVANTNSASSTNYKINNAFTFGGQELKGLWVGKFSSSVGDPTATTAQTAIYIKPNVIGWRAANLATYFTSTRNMELARNIYGFSQSENAKTVTTTGAGTYGDIPNDANQIDTHLIKNSEWGAVAYLSQSLYGRCTTTSCPEIAQNNSTAYYTGRGSGDNTITSVTGSYVYNTKEGTMSSTTYNVYGIYDMVNYSYEMVMGNYNTNTNNPTTMTSPGSSGFTIANYPNKKYVDYYYADATNCGNNDSCYGHALTETKTWYNDFYQFFETSTSRFWFIRGGGSVDNRNYGLFSIAGTIGGNWSFHTVLVNF